MNQIIFPEDVANVIQSFAYVNEGDESSVGIIIAIGAELLDISHDSMIDMIK